VWISLTSNRPPRCVSEACSSRKEKAAVERMLKDLDESGKPKKAREMDTESILKGERPAVVKRVEKLKDREVLERVREAEAAGEQRASVLIAIDQALGYV